MIGYMEMPADFMYKDVFQRGQPVHAPFDAFRLRHPSMDPGRRAKIFAPFDALIGFDDEIASTEVLYESRRELSDGEKEELGRRLEILYRLTWNSRLARENAVPVEVTYFVPGANENSPSRGSRGRYVTLSGICRRIGRHTVTVGETVVRLSDIARMESPMEADGRNIFDFREDETA